MLLGSAVLLACILAARLSTRLGLPSLLIFLGLGMVVGELGLKFTDAGLAHTLGFAALVLILAEGGFTTKWSEIKNALPIAILLATVGVVTQVALVAVFAHFVLGIEPITAILLGAVTSPTDSAAVFSVLRKVPLPSRIRATLEAESGFNDAPIVLLVTTATVWAVSGIDDNPAALIGDVLWELVGGLALGVAVGFVGAFVMRRIALPASGLYPLAALGWAILAYGAGSSLHLSGFAAVYVASVVLGNSNLPHRHATRSFAEGIGWIAQIGLFVMLGLLADAMRISPTAITGAVIIGVFLTFAARPLAVFLCSVWFKVPLREMAFVSWAGLRGAVPIIMALVPLAENAPGSDFIFDTVFCFVIVFTVLQAPTLPWASRLLKVSKGEDSTDIDIEFAPLDNIKADMMQVHIEPGSRLHGVSVREVRLPKNSVISLIVRDHETFTPHAETRLLTGDDLLIVTRVEDRQKVERRLRSLSDYGRLARWRDS
ncbi:MAG: potassium/proton antiporter [Propionibacteriaceae bacterium]|nr:potassium/proton antiporter [Propionibacteriaceae bacterium]